MAIPKPNPGACTQKQKQNTKKDKDVWMDEDTNWWVETDVFKLPPPGTNPTK